MTKKILVINLGWEQEPLLDLIDASGLELYGIHDSDGYYSRPRYRDILISDFKDLKRITMYAEKVKPDAVISDQCDYSYLAQAVISEKLGLPGPSVSHALIATNKYLQRLQVSKRVGYSPQFTLSFGPNDVIRFMEKQSGNPIMVKSVDNRGSYGVNKVDNISECASAYYDSLINSPSRCVLAEEFIEGTHITVDGYCFDGIGVRVLGVASKKKLKDKKEIIDGEIFYPAQVDTQEYEKIQRAFYDIVDAIGFSFGFIHAEFIISRDGLVYLTEIANRGGGVRTSEVIIPNVSGIDINLIYLNDCLGEKTVSLDCDINTISRKCTMMKFFSFEGLENGIVDNIKGLESLSHCPGVLFVRMMLKKGDIIREVRGGGDRHGVIIVTGNDYEDVCLKMKNTISNISVSIL